LATTKVPVAGVTIARSAIVGDAVKAMIQPLAVGHFSAQEAI
jgi:hypothetical protein